MATAKLRPLGDRVVIKPTPREEMTKSGIVLPDTAKEKPQEGEIIAVGPGRILDDGKRETMDVKKGEKVRIRYMNEGLQIHPMHLHGIPQTVIAHDGFPSPPQQEDTVMVAPGQRVTVLIKPTAAQTGVWAYHCHVLTHAESRHGMFGMVTVLIVQE